MSKLCNYIKVDMFYVHQCVLCSICLDIGRKCIILLYFVYFLCWTVGVNVSIRGKRLVFQYAQIEWRGGRALHKLSARQISQRIKDNTLFGRKHIKKNYQSQKKISILLALSCLGECIRRHAYIDKVCQKYPPHTFWDKPT